MKKIIVLIILLIGMSDMTYAQRYLPHQKGVQVSGGLVDFREDSYYGGIHYSVYTKNKNRWVIGAEFLNRNSRFENKNIPVSQFTGEAGYYMHLFSDKKDIFFFSLGISALCGYETINWNKRHLSSGAMIEDTDHFVGGGALSFEMEAFLTDRVALLFNIRERCLLGGDTDKFHNQIGVGIKYIFN